MRTGKLYERKGIQEFYRLYLHRGGLIKEPLQMYGMSTKSSFQQISQVVMGTIATGLFVLITVSVIGAYYPRTLLVLHLDWLYVPLRGIYADCSDPENQGVGFCSESRLSTPDGRVPSRDRDRPLPFSLNSHD